MYQLIVYNFCDDYKDREMNFNIYNKTDFKDIQKIIIDEYNERADEYYDWEKPEMLLSNTTPIDKEFEKKWEELFRGEYVDLRKKYEITEIDIMEMFKDKLINCKNI